MSETLPVEKCFELDTQRRKEMFKGPGKVTWPDLVHLSGSACEGLPAPALAVTWCCSSPPAPASLPWDPGGK